MKEQKFLIVDNPGDVNDWLEKGWKVISVTSQHVTITGTSYNYLKGNFAVVIQKQNK